MSIGERYIRAASSPRLKLEANKTGDLDVVIAAGFADNLGTLLLRCRQEWDASRGTLERAEDELRRLNHLADLEQSSVHVGPTRAALLRRNAEDATLHTRALILLGMTSLFSAKTWMKRHALSRVARRGMVLDKGQVANTVGAALDIWLDQRCPKCEGRGRNGGYGAPQVICRSCRGIGIKRRVFHSKSSDEVALVEWLVAESDRLVAEAQHKIQKGLR